MHAARSLLVLSLVAAVGIPGCQQVDAPGAAPSGEKGTPPVTSTAAPRVSFSTNDTRTPEQQLDDATDEMSLDAAGTRVGVSVEEDDGDSISRVARVFAGKLNRSGRWMMIQYTDGVDLYVEDLGTPWDGRQWLVDQDSNTQLAPHLRKFKIRGFDARAEPALAIGPVDLPDGTVKPGTGLYNGGARVEWVVGRFGVSIGYGANEERSLDDLIEFAQTVVVTPR